MLRLFQCEKAVTNSEPMGRPKAGSEVPTGSKTPIDLLGRAGMTLGAAVTELSSVFLTGFFHCVFNDLQAEAACWQKRVGGAVHYVGDGHVVSTRGARFGPNFVTIQPLGVCVCSF
jgi:hypothetical protein